MSLELLNNPAVQFVLTVCVIVLFTQFCRLAKKVTLPKIVKTAIMVLTIGALIVCNVLYSKGNALIEAEGDYHTATLALICSLVWVCIFAFGLMAETKKKPQLEDEAE